MRVKLEMLEIKICLDQFVFFDPVISDPELHTIYKWLFTISSRPWGFNVIYLI